MLLFQWVLAIILLHLSQVTEEFHHFNNMHRRPRPYSSRIGRRSEDCKSCSCGVAYSKRIIGGATANVKKYPWMAILFSQGYFLCGGSLINNKYVLTAAHCVDQSKVSGYEVRFLQNDIISRLPITIVRKIRRATRHPNYNDQTGENDIALLKLIHRVVFNGQISPVCLPSETSSFEGQNGTVVGWGAKREDGKASRQLQEVNIPIITLEQCHDYGLPVTTNMMCAVDEDGGKDSCQGDSGGPLHVYNDSKFIQAGIISWGDGCGRAKRPGAYTQVANYVTWIRENTARACYC